MATLTITGFAFDYALTVASYNERQAEIMQFVPELHDRIKFAGTRNGFAVKPTMGQLYRVGEALYELDTNQWYPIEDGKRTYVLGNTVTKEAWLVKWNEQVVKVVTKGAGMHEQRIVRPTCQPLTKEGVGSKYTLNYGSSSRTWVVGKDIMPKIRGAANFDNPGLEAAWSWQHIVCRILEDKNIYIPETDETWAMSHIIEGYRRQMLRREGLPQVGYGMNRIESDEEGLYVKSYFNGSMSKKRCKFASADVEGMFNAARNS